MCSPGPVLGRWEEGPAHRMPGRLGVRKTRPSLLLTLRGPSYAPEQEEGFPQRPGLRDHEGGPTGCHGGPVPVKLPLTVLPQTELSLRVAGEWAAEGPRLGRGSTPRGFLCCRSRQASGREPPRLVQQTLGDGDFSLGAPVAQGGCWALVFLRCGSEFHLLQRRCWGQRAHLLG